MNKERVLELYPEAKITNDQFVDTKLGIRFAGNEEKIALEGRYTPEQIEAVAWYLTHRDTFVSLTRGASQT